jgi:hypothetical protein
VKAAWKCVRDGERCVRSDAPSAPRDSSRSYLSDLRLEDFFHASTPLASSSHSRTSSAITVSGTTVLTPWRRSSDEARDFSQSGSSSDQWPLTL